MMRSLWITVVSMAVAPSGLLGGCAMVPVNNLGGPGAGLEARAGRADQTLAELTPDALAASGNALLPGSRGPLREGPALATAVTLATPAQTGVSLNAAPSLLSGVTATVALAGPLLGANGGQPSLLGATATLGVPAVLEHTAAVAPTPAVSTTTQTVALATTQLVSSTMAVVNQATTSSVLAPPAVGVPSALQLPALVRLLPTNPLIH